MWLRRDQLITATCDVHERDHVWAPNVTLHRDVHVSVQTHIHVNVLYHSCECWSLILLSVVWGWAGRPELCLLQFKASLWPTPNWERFSVPYFSGFNILVWQLCKHVVEQSWEPLQLVMMWKSQLCSSSVVMKTQSSLSSGSRSVGGATMTQTLSDKKLN